jgi:hypothetical protein
MKRQLWAKSIKRARACQLSQGAMKSRQGMQVPTCAVREELSFCSDEPPNGSSGEQPPAISRSPSAAPTPTTLLLAFPDLIATLPLR